MSDLLSWLKTTIEGDKAAAEAAAAPRKGRYNIVDADGQRHFDHTPRPYNGEWRLSEDRDAVVPCCPEADAVVSGSCGCCCPTSQGQEADLAHVAIHDPRDTIVRCKAELKILDLHKMVEVSEYEQRLGGTYGQPFGCSICHEDDGITVGLGICDTVRTLACGYRHRPGFDATLVLDPAEVAAILAGAEERRKQPLQTDDLGELRARLDVLKAEGARDDR